jgi:hypothetical protein
LILDLLIGGGQLYAATSDQCACIVSKWGTVQYSYMHDNQLAFFFWPPQATELAWLLNPIVSVCT